MDYVPSDRRSALRQVLTGRAREVTVCAAVLAAACLTYYAIRLPH